MHDTRRTRLVLSVLLIAALALITIDYRGGSSGPLRSLGNVGNTMFGPLERLAGHVTRPVSQLASGISSGARISALQRQNAQLRAELSQARLSSAQDAQLRKLLQLTARGRYRVVAANVIAAATGYADTVTIDVGSRDGVKPNETVLNGNGLVGRTVSVSSTTSTVLLATDGSSTVGSRLAGTGQIGSVSGTGKGLSGPNMLHLQLFSGSAVLHAGGPARHVRLGRRQPVRARRADRDGCPAGNVVQRADQERAGPPVRQLQFARRRRGGHRAAAGQSQGLGAAAAPARHPDAHRDQDGVSHLRAPLPAPGTSPRRAVRRHRARGTDVRRFLLPVVLLLVAVVVQLTVLDRLPLPGGVAPDLVLLVVVALALNSGPMTGMICGFCAGLALDIAPPSGHLIGVYALVFCLLGYFCGLVSTELESSVLLPLAASAAGAAAGAALYAAVGIVLGNPDVTGPAVRHVLPLSVLYDVLLSPFVLFGVALAYRLAARLAGAGRPSRAPAAAGGGRAGHARAPGGPHPAASRRRGQAAGRLDRRRRVAGGQR